MFNNRVNLMLYVPDVAAEKAFWQALGFTIISEEEMMGFDFFDMKPTQESHLVISVFDEDFIRQVSPEVADNRPSVLFECDDIKALHQLVASQTDTASPIQTQPFPNFNFASPSGQYFAVKGR